MSGAGSIEAFESVSPLVVWRKQLRPDSGGPGRFRGGLGQEAEIEVRSPGPLRLSLLSDRRDHPALGLLGGGDGAPAVIEFADGTRPHPKSRTTVAPGTRLRMVYAGGGGYGDPKARDPAAVSERPARRIHHGRGGARAITGSSRAMRADCRAPRRRCRRHLHRSRAARSRAAISSIPASCLTTPDDPSEAIVGGIARLLREVGLTPGAICTASCTAPRW